MGENLNLMQLVQAVEAQSQFLWVAAKPANSGHADAMFVPACRAVTQRSGQKSAERLKKNEKTAVGGPREYNNQAAAPPTLSPAGSRGARAFNAIQARHPARLEDCQPRVLGLCSVSSRAGWSGSCDARPTPQRFA